MGMVVRTNMAGLNANNALNMASKTQQNAMQKLASGFRINKAADDASGLAISEKMKNQIKALDTAADNCEDGANLIQTTEGYMAEAHDMLNRMVELSEKAANGVLDDTDRDALQDEMDELCAEIDRMATTANFNGKKLMDGSIGSNGIVKITSDTDGNHYSVDSQAAYSIKYTPTAANVTAAVTGTGVTDANSVAKLTELINKEVVAVAKTDSTATASMDTLAQAVETAKKAVETAQKDLLADPTNNTKVTALTTATNNLTTAQNNLKTGNGTTTTVTVFANSKGDVYATLDDTDEKSTELKKDEYNATTNTEGYFKQTITVSLSSTTDTAIDNEGIKLQIGESSTAADKLEVSVGSFHTDTLLGGIKGFVNNTASGTGETDADAMAETVANATSTYDNAITVDISDQNKASAAADALRQVSNYVSDQRGKLGAQQNRLDHTVNNLTTTSENITASNSRIRDTNMAEEMMNYTSKNVIAQAAQAMLAQANSQPQNVLSLLQ